MGEQKQITQDGRHTEPSPVCRRTVPCLPSVDSANIEKEVPKSYEASHKIILE